MVLRGQAIFTHTHTHTHARARANEENRTIGKSFAQVFVAGSGRWPQTASASQVLLKPLHGGTQFSGESWTARVILVIEDVRCLVPDMTDDLHPSHQTDLASLPDVPLFIVQIKFAIVQLSCET